MLRHLGFVSILAGVLTACAVTDMPQGGRTGGTLETFAHRVATSEVVLLWNCLQPEPGQLRVEGVAQNPWQAQPIQYLEFELVGVDAQERQTAQVAEAARDLQIRTNQTAPFQLTLKTAGTEVRFDLYYNYRFNDNVDLGAARGLLVAGPPMVSPRLLAQTQRFLVRDVCSPTQHLAR
ncbi:MAG: hypothetical protein NTW68_18950 [candidate division NC10 bacterium]|nr:hypothetical protein [candidate division NC10 bacterium]